MSHKPPVILLMGPTASGKTAVAVELVAELPCDIISVDSALVYRGMDIGTAKPDAETLACAPHRLIDIRDPAETYSAGQFRRDALAEIAAIHAQGRVPLLVGGTMLYYRALLQGVADLPQADTALREKLQAELAAEGVAALHRRLAAVDPDSAARIHPNDPQRTLRALEVHELTGQTLTQWHQRQRPTELPFQPIKLAIAPQDRAELHRRIALRFESMLHQGFEAEVAGLMARGDLHPELPAMRSVGYRQMWAYLCGETDHATMVERGIIATRQLAKRQFTWLRSESEVRWFDPLRGAIGEDLLRYVSQNGSGFL